MEPYELVQQELEERKVGEQIICAFSQNTAKIDALPEYEEEEIASQQEASIKTPSKAMHPSVLDKTTFVVNKIPSPKQINHVAQPKVPTMHADADVHVITSDLPSHRPLHAEKKQQPQQQQPLVTNDTSSFSHVQSKLSSYIHDFARIRVQTRAESNSFIIYSGVKPKQRKKKKKVENDVDAGKPKPFLKRSEKSVLYKPRDHEKPFLPPHRKISAPTSNLIMNTSASTITSAMQQQLVEPSIASTAEKMQKIDFEDGFVLRRNFAVQEEQQQMENVEISSNFVQNDAVEDDCTNSIPMSSSHPSTMVIHQSVQQFEQYHSKDQDVEESCEDEEDDNEENQTDTAKDDQEDCEEELVVDMVDEEDALEQENETVIHSEQGNEKMQANNQHLNPMQHELQQCEPLVEPLVLHETLATTSLPQATETNDDIQTCANTVTPILHVQVQQPQQSNTKSLPVMKKSNSTTITAPKPSVPSSNKPLPPLVDYSAVYPHVLDLFAPFYKKKDMSKQDVEMAYQLAHVTIFSSLHDLECHSTSQIYATTTTRFHLLVLHYSTNQTRSHSCCQYGIGRFGMEIGCQQWIVELAMDMVIKTND